MALITFLLLMCPPVHWFNGFFDGWHEWETGVCNGFYVFDGFWGFKLGFLMFFEGLCLALYCSLQLGFLSLGENGGFLFYGDG